MNNKNCQNDMNNKNCQNDMNDINNRKDLIKYIEKNKRKHIIIKVSASWCKPCIKMNPVFKNLLNDLERKNENNILYLDMDINKDSDCCTYLRVKSIPHILYFKNGQINQNMVGYNDKNLNKLFSYINRNIKIYSN